jgi:hypothetical protein
MERIILKHLSGSKANQVEEFPLNHIKELVLGRDPSATVKYDPDRDDLVGRQHARIEQDAADSTQFTITDLDSRNGTYVNKQRIVGAAKIAPGDLIQLGPGGPELQFDLEPRPVNSVRQTREAISDPQASTLALNSLPAVPTTRTVDTTGQSQSEAITPRATVGKATVERMITETISETKKTEGRRYMMMGGAAILGVLLVFGIIAAVLAYRSRSSEAELSNVQKQMAGAPLSQSQIVASNQNTVVKLEISWKLLSPTGLPVYHQYGNYDVRKDKKTGTNQIVPNLEHKESVLPCYIKLADGTIEPMMTTTNDKSTHPILGQYTGTGFVLNSDGFILTTRFNALAWDNEYPLPDFKEALLFDKNRQFLANVEREVLIDEYKIPMSWVPSKLRQAIDGTTGRYTGNNDSLYVTFPGTGRRYVGQLVVGSEEQDVALIKVSLPTPLQPVQIPEDSESDSVKQGDQISMLGYPEDAVREVTVGRTKMSARNQLGDQIEIAAPSFYPGSIGRLLRGREASGGREGVYSELGDVYQLTISLTSLGNSGSPIFDDHGRVIAIFSVGSDASSTRTFAVPIRYGKKLMEASAPAK